MTKADLVNKLYENMHLPRRDCVQLVENVLEQMKSGLEKGEKVKISGFGNFVVRNKGARVGRNMWTHSPIPIEARRTLTFKPSQLLKERLNNTSDVSGTDEGEKIESASAQPAAESVTSTENAGLPEVEGQRTDF